MKNCKSCKKEIDEMAIKCPFCQSFQVWYRNPQVYGMIFPLVFLPVIFYSTGLFGGPKYENYKEMISSSLQSERFVDNAKVLNYNIINNSNVVWNDISYESIGYDKDGGIVVSACGNEFRWILPANGAAMISVKVSKDEQIVRWDFRIMAMRKDRF